MSVRKFTPGGDASVSGKHNAGLRDRCHGKRSCVVVSLRYQGFRGRI